MRQSDLFAPTQSELDLDKPRDTAVRADPAKVRSELHLILSEMRNASEMPWDERTLSYHQLVFPQMSRWLPEDEAAQLKFEFQEEVRRLLAA